MMLNTLSSFINSHNVDSRITFSHANVIEPKPLVLYSSMIFLFASSLYICIGLFCTFSIIYCFKYKIFLSNSIK